MVSWSGSTGKVPQASIVASIRCALKDKATSIAVDMPIGFPADTARSCETFARKYVGPRRSSVFPVPCRKAVMVGNYSRACEINASLLGKKFSKQAFMLFPKMREIDAVITPELQSRVFEVHPEVSFCAMNNETPLQHSKKTREGADLRRTLLAARGFPIDRLQHPVWKKSQVADDDILDACACAWSAWRIAKGEHITFPRVPQLDDRGLRMEINA